MERETKKKFKSDGILELRTWVYNPNVIEAISDLWGKHAKWCRNNKNEFINDLILRGVESLQLEERNNSEAMRVDTILNRLDNIQASSRNSKEYMRAMFNTLYVQNKINQTLLTRLYHIVFRLSCAEGLNADIYDTGALDFLRCEDKLYKQFNEELGHFEDSLYEN